MPASNQGSTFRFHAFGHPNILATHPTTLEFTTEENVTSRGDCIIGVRATTAPANLPGELRRLLTIDNRAVLLTIRAGKESFEVHGTGSKQLTLSHQKEMVVRRSDFASERTVLVKADGAARDIPRRMVRLIRNPHQTIEAEFREI